MWWWGFASVAPPPPPQSFSKLNSAVTHGATFTSDRPLCRVSRLFRNLHRANIRLAKHDERGAPMAASGT